MKSAVAYAMSLIATPLLVLTFSGCIQMEHDLRIDSDGSAAYRLNYAITEQAVRQFRAMFKLKNELAIAAGEPAPGPELEPLLLVFLDPNEADLRKQLAPFADIGISIRSLRQETRAAGRHVELQLDIKDLQTLAGNPFFVKHGFSLYRNEEGGYVWSRRPHIRDVEGLPAPISDRDRDQITPILSGFRTVVKFTPPGRILSSTAARTSLQTASWEFDFNRQPLAVQSLLRQHFHVVFEAPQAVLPELRQP